MVKNHGKIGIKYIC